jgi:S-adenosylmethionine/arginine decarboxylase-like enzyme
MSQFWGYHARANARACDRGSVMSAENIERFVKELVKRIDMVAYGEPRIVMFGEGNKAGYTLDQLIETSNIMAHFCNDTGDAYFDCFSCKPFEMETFLNTIEEFFQPEAMSHDFTTRQA